MVIVNKSALSIRKRELRQIECPACGKNRNEIDFVRIENTKRVVNFKKCNFCYNKFYRLKSQPGAPLDVSAIIENKIFIDCKEKFFDIMNSHGELKINGLIGNDSLLFKLYDGVVNVYQGDIIENSGNILNIWFIYHKLLKNYWGDENRRWGNNNFKLIFKSNKKKFYE